LSLPTLVREMLPEERSLVLSDWKKDLKDARPEWGAALRWDEWWALVNHVIDRLALPSARVYVICHRDEERIPLAWAAVRDGAVLHLHAAAAVLADPELAARLETQLTAPYLKARFNPFEELKR
jgi:hypothetical protein